MIDIHSHIVFDVDDGPKTREDTRTLLEESYRQGVRTIISTSHRRKGMFETHQIRRGQYRRYFQETEKEADVLINQSQNQFQIEKDYLIGKDM